MHESTGRDVYICNADQHGWFYRGPNDSAIDNVQVKTCGWAGFYQESTGNNSVGNLEIGSLHAYSCSCGHAADGAMIDLANANIGFLYSDASLKNGVRFSGSASIVGEIMSLSSNKNNAGAFWGVICDVACQIGMVRNSETTARTTGTDGGLVQINASSTVVGQIRTVQNPSTTISQVGVEINAQCNIGEIIVEAYDSASSVGVLVDSSRVVANINAKNNLLAVDYATAGRNRISIQGEGNTTDIQYTATPSRTDAILVQTDNLSRSERRVGKIIDTALNLDQTDVASASSYTPDASSASYIKISGLAHNITFGAPTNPTRGDVLKIQVQQDGTGGRTITWNSAYKTGYSDTGNTAFTRHVITFVYDGTFWVEQSRSGWF